jgi:hypothetical protein
MRLAHVQLDAIFGSPAANRKTVTNHIALRLVRLQGLVGRICHFKYLFWVCCGPLDWIWSCDACVSVGPWLSGLVMRNLVLFWVLEECQAFQTLLALLLWDDENAGEFIRWSTKWCCPVSWYWSTLNISNLSFLPQRSFNYQFASWDASVTLPLFLNHPPFYSFLPQYRRTSPCSSSRNRDHDQNGQGGKFPLPYSLVWEWWN